MGNKLFDLLSICTTLITHVYADIDKGDPLFNDIKTAVQALEAALSAAKDGKGAAAQS